MKNLKNTYWRCTEYPASLYFKVIKKVDEGDKNYLISSMSSNNLWLCSFSIGGGILKPGTRIAESYEYITGCIQLTEKEYNLRIMK
jgi:hypothetical protein